MEISEHILAPHKGLEEHKIDTRDTIVLLTNDTEVYFSRSRSTQLFTTYRTVVNTFAQRTVDRNRHVQTFMAGSSGFSLVSEIAQFVFNAIALEAVYLLAVEIFQLLAYIISSN